MPLSLLLTPQGAIDPPSTTYDLREAIVSRALAASAITAIVGQRFRPRKLPQSDPRRQPSITFDLPSNRYSHFLWGANGTAVATVQFNCWSIKTSEIVRMRNALRDVFDGFYGTVLGVEMWASQLGEVEVGVPENDGSDDAITHLAIDYRFKIRCPIPSPV